MSLMRNAESTPDSVMVTASKPSGVLMRRSAQAVIR